MTGRAGKTAFSPCSGERAADCRQTHFSPREGEKILTILFENAHNKSNAYVKKQCLCEEAAAFSPYSGEKAAAYPSEKDQ